ncbi:hypothetical protein SUDANB37_00386 [Streptomyces sp. enrichment culture]
MALPEMANAESVLHDEYTSCDRAATAVRSRLRDVATGPALLPAARAPGAAARRRPRTATGAARARHDRGRSRARRPAP